MGLANSGGAQDADVWPNGERKLGPIDQKGDLGDHGESFKGLSLVGEDVGGLVLGIHGVFDIGIGWFF